MQLILVLILTGIVGYFLGRRHIGGRLYQSARGRLRRDGKKTSDPVVVEGEARDVN